MLETQNLSFSYTAQNTLNFPNIRCNANETLLLLGASGCGKTTLLHLLGGLLSPKSGKIMLNNTDFTALSSNERDAFRGKNIGIVFQKSHFVKALNVVENLVLAQELAGAKLDKKSIIAVLEKLNLAHKQNAKPDELSVGEAQRVAIARAILNSPSVILADEPTSALDDANAKEVIALLTEQAKSANAALIVVTHDQRLKNFVQNQVVL